MASGVTGRDELDRILSSPFGKTLRPRIRELSQAGLPTALAEFNADYYRHNVHDSIIDICASAFGPQSAIYRDLGYAFLSSEPLYEKDLKNFDVLIYRASTKHAIFVECKSSVAAPADEVRSVYDAINVVLTNKGYLEQSVGDTFDRIEFVVCVPAESTQRMAEEIGRREADATKPADRPRLLLWQVNVFAGQTLQLASLIPDRTKVNSSHRDADLNKTLSKGLKVDSSEVLVKAYPSSHPLRQAKVAVQYCMFRNQALDRSLREIRERDLEDFFANPGNIPHYASSVVGPRLRDRFVNEGVDGGLLKRVENRADVLEMQVEGKTPRTLLSNYEKGYREMAARRVAERRAESQAVAEFRKEHPAYF